MCSHSTPVDVRMARMQVRQLPVRLCTAACFKGIPDAVRLAGWLAAACRAATVNSESEHRSVQVVLACLCTETFLLLYTLATEECS